MPAWWQLGSGLLATAGAVLSVISLFSNEDWTQTALAIGLSLVAVVAIGMAFGTLHSATLNASQAARAVAWSKGMKNYSNASQHIADIAADLGGKRSRDPQERASSACVELEKAFTSVSSNDCRVTVKELYSEDGALAVRTLIAPSRHTMKSGVTDLVAANTDFAAILDGKDLYLCNDIPAEVTRGYLNSHWTPEDLALWAEKGDYPYRSALILPVRTRLPQGDAKNEAWATLGFLCIDSQEPDAFDFTEDRHVAELAAAMFVTV